MWIDPDGTVSSHVIDRLSEKIW